MIPMSEALGTIAEKVGPLSPRQIPTSSSLQKIVADDIVSKDAHPSFRASIKDGYAIRYPPGLVAPNNPFSIRDDITMTAGSEFGHEKELNPGEAAYVTTGAMVPNKTDCVVMIEKCRRQNDQLFINENPENGADIREVGSDIQLGEVILKKGTQITPTEIGLLHTCGIASINVIGTPIIGIFSSGDELYDLSDQQLQSQQKGKIIDSNRPMLKCLIRESLSMCEVVDFGILSDEEQLITDKLREASEQCHIIITSGGVSMGKKDYIKPILSKLFTVHFGRVLMKPGKPLTFATKSEQHCFLALPGNPISCFVCFHLAVVLAARRLSGWSIEQCLENGFNKVKARLAHPIKLDPVRPEFHRAVLTWSNDQTPGYVAVSTGNQASSRLLSARYANALLELPSSNSTLSSGEMVDAYLISAGHFSNMAGLSQMRMKSDDAQVKHSAGILNIK